MTFPSGQRCNCDKCVVWRAELVEIYDKAYRRTHGGGEEPGQSGGAGARKPRKPTPSAPTTEATADLPVDVASL